jgi:hypothetical protein
MLGLGNSIYDYLKAFPLSALIYSSIVNNGNTTKCPLRELWSGALHSHILETLWYPHREILVREHNRVINHVLSLGSYQVTRKKFEAKWQQEMLDNERHELCSTSGTSSSTKSEPARSKIQPRDEQGDEEHGLLPQPHHLYLRWIALCDVDTVKMFETFIQTTYDDTSDYTVPIRTRFRSYTGRWIMPLSWRRMLIDQECLCTLSVIKKKRDIPSRFGFVFADIPDGE